MKSRRLLKYCWRDIRGKRNLTISTVAIVAIAISIYVTVAPILDYLVAGTDKLRILGDILISKKPDAKSKVFSDKDVNDVEKLDSDFGVEGLVIIPGDFSTFMIIGLDPVKDNQFAGPTTKVYNPSNWDRKLGLNEALVGSSTNKKIGDSISTHETTLTVVGQFSTGTLLYDTMIIVNKDTAWKMAGKGQEYYTHLAVNVNGGGTDPKKVVDKSNEIKKEFPDYDVKSPGDEFRKTLSAVNMVFLTSNSIIVYILISTFTTVTFLFYMNVRERRRDFALLKAVGWPSKIVRRCVTIECLMLGALGAFLGLFLGLVMTSLIQMFILYKPSVFVSPLVPPLAISIAVIVSGIGGLYPAWIASSVRPSTVLREK